MRRRFTLVELMVAVALSVVLVGVLAVAFRAATRSYNFV